MRGLLIMFLALSACTVVGCTQISAPIRPTADKSDNSVLSGDQYSEVGGAVVRQEDVLTFPAFSTEKWVEFKEENIERIPPGTMFTAAFQGPGETYQCSPPMATPLVVFGRPEPSTCLWISKEGLVKGSCTCGMPGTCYEFYSQQPPVQMKLATTYAPGSIRKEILYNGKSKNTIKMVYREFANDMARPAFYQDLSYDLSESKVIGFRGLLIEVLEATNTGIKYRFTKRSWI